MAAKPKVLIVDDEPEIGGLLKLFLEDDFEVVTHTDPRAACEEVNRAWYDIVLSDIRMPFLTGHEVLQFVKKNSPSTEVVLITGHAQTEKDRDHALKLGASGILLKPFGDPAQVVDYLKHVIMEKGGNLEDHVDDIHAGPSERNRPKILVIDDEPDLVAVVELILSPKYEVVGFTDPVAAIEAARVGGFSCYITDLSMPQMRGRDVISQLKSIAADVPIFVMSGHSALDREVVESMKLGACALLPKPFPDSNEILSLIGKFIA